VDALKDFEGTMIFVSHDRMFLRGLGSRVLELAVRAARIAIPLFIPGHTLSTCRSLDMKRLGSIRRFCRAFCDDSPGGYWANLARELAPASGSFFGY